MKEHEEYLAFAKSLAAEAGKIMKRHFQIGLDHDMKDDNSPVTVADEAVNQLVIDRVKSTYPTHGILGEEDSYKTEAKDLWVVDPIDGTMPYLRGVPINVFSLALVQDGEPVVGVIYDPYLDRLFWATKGGGAFMNGEKISTASTKTLKRSYTTVEGHKLFKNFDYRQKMYDLEARIFNYGCVAYEFSMLAAGQFEACVFPVGNAWDVAAGKIIVEEAGGVTSDLRGRPQRYDRETKGFIAACTPEVHKQTVELYAGSVKDSI